MALEDTKVLRNNVVPGGVEGTVLLKGGDVGRRVRSGERVARYCIMIRKWSEVLRKAETLAGAEAAARGSRDNILL